MVRDSYWPLRVEVYEEVVAFVESVKDREPDIRWFDQIVAEKKRWLFGYKYSARLGHINGWKIPDLTTAFEGLNVQIYVLEDHGLLVPFRTIHLPAMWSGDQRIRETASLKWVSVLDPVMPPNALNETKIALERCLSKK
jgi:hypothetical protein